uniref:NADH-ubiquinone oxidoreductase chain 5 n=1 Tax=Stygobromus allegheniensis TaxID=1677011 RepID=A0A6C0X4X1_9CRUS|nr:NADH dehydrogenase subunit 5 [Stygobromus allegheniensis]QIC54425.1 NADH dehydrogenase subunit 5 [Stygobromus allegheniensis]
MSMNYGVYVVWCSVLGLFSVVTGFSAACFLSMDTSLFIEWEIFVSSSSTVVFSLIYDWMSMSFLSTVGLISSSIMAYCIYYMDGDKSFHRFSLILLLFVFSMMILIISPNLVSLLLGWDGLGLSSYALIIYYQSESSCNAGMVTVLSNRLGDVGLLMGIGLWASAGSWNFSLSLQSANLVLMGFILLAGLTKSAQIPFSAWLPAAMAAPTPVSALVHSSTLVTAGVYLMIRFNSMLQESGLNSFLLVIAVSTMFMAGLGANFESDVKKVIALSTLSQLGLMMMSLSVGLSELAFFHLMTHALFKSSLFMCAGCVIHTGGGSQDTRNYGGLGFSSPLLSVLFNCTNMALCGFPCLAGFYSKDLILEMMVGGGLSWFCEVMIVLATGLTVSYSLRMMYMLNSEEVQGSSVSNVEDAGSGVAKAVTVLFVMSLVGGFFLSWALIYGNKAVLLCSLDKGLVGLASLMFGVGAVFLCFKSEKFVVSLSMFQALVFSMWYLPMLTTKMNVFVSMKTGGLSLKGLDLGWYEFYGAQGARGAGLKWGGLLQLGQKSILVSSYLMGFSLLVLVSLLMF